MGTSRIFYLQMRELRRKEGGQYFRFSTKKMWVWKKYNKVRNHSSAWDVGKKIFYFLHWTHTKSANYLKYQKKQKAKISKLYSGAECATHLTHNGIKCTHTNNVLKFKILIISFVQHVWMRLFLLYSIFWLI